jgi:hypothetical protein
MAKHLYELAHCICGMLPALTAKYSRIIRIKRIGTGEELL